MPVLNGPDNFNNQFTVAADGTISLTTTPLPIGGGTISPGPVIINNNATAPQATVDAPQLWVSAPAAVILADSYGTVGSYIVGRAARGTAAAPTALQANDALVSFGAEGRAPSGYNADVGGLTLYAAENWTATANGTALILATVTVGTTTNRSRAVVGPGMQVCTAAGGSPTGADMGAGTVNAASGYYVNGGGAAGVALVASGNSYINSGNVGIGTTTPTQGKLVVAGSGFTLATVRDTTVGDYAFLAAGGQTGYVGVTGVSNLFFMTNGVGQASILSNGSFGIGTLGPGALLQVGAPATSGGQEGLGCTALLTAPSDGNNPLILQRSGVVNPQMLNFGLNHTSHWSEIQSAQSNVGFTSLILNRQGGNVGIGTTTPSQKLAVVTATTTSPVGILVSNGSITQERALFGVEGNTSGASMGGSLPYALLVNDADGHGLQLGTANAARVTIDGGGNVGIGTSAPGAKLTVNGVMTATGATFSGGVQLSYGTPIFGLIDTGGALDTKNYLLLATGGTLYAQFSNDASSLSATWLTVSRSGYTPSTITLSTGASLARLTITTGVQVGAPSGGDKGVGTINAVTVYGNNVVLTSDADLKTDIKPLPPCIPLVAAIDPKSFKWRSLAKKGDEPADFTTKLNRGFLAQNVAKVLGGSKDEVDLSGLIAVLWQAVKELNAKVAALESATVH